MVGRLGIAVLFSVLLACSSEESADNEDMAAIERGQVSYELYCALCHGALGQGYVSPKANALTNEDFLISSTDDFLFVGIEQGRTETKMSSYGRDYLGPMTDDEIHEVIAYLRSYQTEETLSSMRLGKLLARSTMGRFSTRRSARVVMVRISREIQR